MPRIADSFIQGLDAEEIRYKQLGATGTKHLYNNCPLRIQVCLVLGSFQTTLHALYAN